MAKFAKDQLLRKTLFLFSLSLIVFLLIFSIIVKRLKPFILNLLQSFKEHWLSFIVFLVLFSVVYVVVFVFLTHDFGYKLTYHLGLLITFLLSYIFFSLFNETFKFFKMKEWMTYVFPLFGFIFSASWLIVYAYLFDYMWLFGI